MVFAKVDYPLCDFKKYSLVSIFTYVPLELDKAGLIETPIPIFAFIKDVRKVLLWYWRYDYAYNYGLKSFKNIDLAKRLVLALGA